MQITTLSNGVRVATRSSNSHFFNVGCFLQGGARIDPNRTCAVLEKIAFKSTAKYSTAQITEKLEAMGGQVECKATREYMLYQAQIFKADLPNIMELLSEMILHPLLKEKHLHEVKETLAFDIKNHQWQHDIILPDQLHQVAYRKATTDTVTDSVGFESSSLGNSLISTTDSLTKINTAHIRAFRDLWFTPDRLVIAGVGMEHEILVDLAQKYFGDMKPASIAIQDAQRSLSLPAVYAGGTRITDTTSLPISPNPDDMNLSHIHIGFEAMATNDPDIYSLAIMQSLLGGGGSFSAGGPGKGMYTRLYTGVLNSCGWFEQINVFNHAYSDSSIFGIQAAIHPHSDTHKHVLPVILDQFSKLLKNPKTEEFNRAKNQLSSNLLMGLESGLVQLEDLGKHVLSGPTHDFVDVLEISRRIYLVTNDDIVRTARRVLLGDRTKSRHEFAGSKHWNPVGDGSASIVIHAGLIEKDCLLKANESVEDWGLGIVGSKKKSNWF